MTPAEVHAAVALLAFLERDAEAYRYPRDEAALDAAWDYAEAVADAVEADLTRLGVDRDAAYTGAHAWIYSRL